MGKRQAMNQADTKYELESAERALRHSRSEHQGAVRARNALILKALEEGVRPVEIARLTGLSRARVSQISGS